MEDRLGMKKWSKGPSLELFAQIMKDIGWGTYREMNELEWDRCKCREVVIYQFSLKIECRMVMMMMKNN